MAVPFVGTPKLSGHQFPQKKKKKMKKRRGQTQTETKRQRERVRDTETKKGRLKELGKTWKL